MKRMEKILSVVHDTYLSSFWIRMIDRSSVKKLSSNEEDSNANRDRYEVSLYVSFSNTEELEVSEFYGEINEVIKAIESVLIPNLDRVFCFISKVKEVKRSESSVEIVVLCEKV